MKKNLIILFLCIVNYSCICAQDLSLKLTIDKNEFLKGETIYGFAFLTNNSSTIKICPINGSTELQFLLMDNNRNLLQSGVALTPLDCPEKVNFQQGESMGAFLQISRAISKDSTPGISVWEPRSVKTGKYILQLKYIYRDASNSSKEQKEFYSDPIEISVVDPETETDKTVYKMLTDESKMHIIDMPYEKTVGYAQMLLNVINKYPDSRYFPGAYNNLFYAFGENDYYKFDTIIENMFSKYPESVMCLIAFSWYEAHRKEVFNSKEFYKNVNGRTKELLKSYNKYFKKLIKEMDDSLL